MKARFKDSGDVFETRPINWIIPMGNDAWVDGVSYDEIPPGVRRYETIEIDYYINGEQVDKDVFEQQYNKAWREYNKKQHKG